MKESAFQGWVVDVFLSHGWTVKHVPTPMRPVSGGKFVPDVRGRGLPDLLLLHDDPPRIVFAECKTGTDLSEDQRTMLRLLRGVAGEVRALADGLEAAEPGTTAGCPFGVYVFKPGVESLIEAVARGRMVA